MLVEANVSVIHHYVYLFAVSCLSAAPLPSFFTFKPHLTFHLSSIRPVSIYFSPLLLSLFVFLSFPLLLFSFPPSCVVSLSVSFCLQTLSSGYCFICKTPLFEWSFI